MDLGELESAFCFHREKVGLTLQFSEFNSRNETSYNWNFTKVEPNDCTSCSWSSAVKWVVFWQIIFLLEFFYAICRTPCIVCVSCFYHLFLVRFDGGLTAVPSAKFGYFWYVKMPAPKINTRKSEAIMIRETICHEKKFLPAHLNSDKFFKEGISIKEASGSVGSVPHIPLQNKGDKNGTVWKQYYELAFLPYNITSGRSPEIY